MTFGRASQDVMSRMRAYKVHLKPLKP